MTAGAATIDTTFTFMQAHYAASAAAMGSSIVVTSLRGTDSCSAIQLASGSDVANVFRVAVTLEGGMLAPGKYALGDGWQATYRKADSLCASSDEGAATEGTLEIDSVGPSVEGIADVTFAGGRVIASFNAPLCDAPKATGAGAACTQVIGCSKATPTETCNQSP